MIILNLMILGAVILMYTVKEILHFIIRNYRLYCLKIDLKVSLVFVLCIDLPDVLSPENVDELRHNLEAEAIKQIEDEKKSKKKRNANKLGIVILIIMYHYAR